MSVLFVMYKDFIYTFLDKILKSLPLYGIVNYMGIERYKRLYLSAVVFAAVIFISILFFNMGEVAFSDGLITVDGTLMYGETITLTVDDSIVADSYYWDYTDNDVNYFVYPNNTGRVHSFVADFVGKRTFRCVYEQGGDTFYESITVDVTKRPIRLKLNRADTYYGEEGELALVVDNTLDETNLGLATGDSINLFQYELDLTICGIKAVEVYTTSQYYSVTCTDNTFNYKRRPIVLCIDYAEYEYGDEIVPVLSVSDSAQSMGLVGTDDLTIFDGSISCEIEGGEPLGLKTVTGACVDGNTGKYEVVSIESGQVLIVPKLVDVYLIDTTIQYGDEVKANYSVDGLLLSDGIDSFELEFDSNVTGFGTFPITAQVLSHPAYYNIDEVYGANVTVVKREVVFDVTSTKVYGEDYDFEYSYATGSRKILNIDQNYIDISITYNNGIVCTATGLEDRYEISFNVLDTVFLPRALNIVLDDNSVTYGSELTDVLIKDYSGLVEGDTLPILFYTTEYKDCGEYALTADYTLNDNYSITLTSATLTVIPRPLTVTIDDKNILYGQAERTLTYTIKYGSIVYGDQLDITLERDEGIDVGEYEIRGQCANANYAVEFINGSYVIEKNLLNINFDKILQNEMFLSGYVYGTSAGTYHVSGYEVKYVFVQDGEETERPIVGECELYGKFEETDNFEESFTYLATCSITPAPITIRALDASKKEKELDPEAFEYEIVSGQLFDGDTLSGALERESGESVGMYSITIGTLENANYLITFEDGTFSIERNVGLRVKTTLIVSACLIVGTVITAFAVIKNRSAKKRESVDK